MVYQTIKSIQGSDGKVYGIDDSVTIKCTNGGGYGGCIIKKITENGFHFNQGGKGRDKVIRYENISEIYLEI